MVEGSLNPARKGDPFSSFLFYKHSFFINVFDCAVSLYLFAHTRKKYANFEHQHSFRLQ